MTVYKLATLATLFFKAKPHPVYPPPPHIHTLTPDVLRIGDFPVMEDGLRAAVKLKQEECSIYYCSSSGATLLSRT